VSRSIALVPIRSLYGGKSRLDSVFDADDRAALVTAMAARLFEKLHESNLVDEIVLLTADPSFTDVFGRWPMTMLTDVPPGLNPAIDHGRRYALESATDRLLIVFPDLPELGVDDLLAIDRSVSPVTIVPDRLVDGTNALFLQGHAAIAEFRPQYGPGSLNAHQAEGGRIGADVAILPLAGMGTDLDTIDDWNSLSEGSRLWLQAAIKRQDMQGPTALMLEYS
jgi:2-phospho-L-lactate/phosphoenolpyruvate guanylyltransferase